jgi:di/tricarboxylate transporter
MAFGSLIGEIVTLVGTSPNILVSRVREEIVGKLFEMFDSAPVGLGILLAGGIPCGGLAPAAGRTRNAGHRHRVFNVDDFVIEATLRETSTFVNKTVADLEGLAEGSIFVIAIAHEQGHRYVPAGHW